MIIYIYIYIYIALTAQGCLQQHMHKAADQFIPLAQPYTVQSNSFQLDLSIYNYSTGKFKLYISIAFSFKIITFLYLMRTVIYTPSS